MCILISISINNQFIYSFEFNIIWQPVYVFIRASSIAPFRDRAMPQMVYSFFNTHTHARARALWIGSSCDDRAEKKC